MDYRLDDLEAELCKRSFYDFVKTFFDIVIKETPVYNWHIEYLCNELQIIGERVKARLPKEYDLIINIPPGTSKSTICTVMFPVWLWVIDPTLRVMTGSYSASLSTDHAVKSRDIITSDKFTRLFPNLKIKIDQNNKTHYKNLEGGERYATSITGTATGFHAHVHVIDDPINPKGSKSEAERDQANNFMDQTLSTRKVDKAITPCILVMQRLHQKDPTGNWLEKKDKRIKHICLPASLSKDIKPIELKSNYIDGMLDPVRMPNNVLVDSKTDLGSYGYAGQFMQVPTPAEGGVWQKWLIPIDDHVFPDQASMTNYGTDWDLAYTEKESNSASAYLTAGKIGNKMYIDSFGFKWLEFPDLVNWMKTQTFPHYIEAKASGKSAKQTLTKNGIPAIEVKVNGGADKVARARSATPYAEAGMVFCRRSMLDSLYNDDKQGILVFPNGDSDDVADVLSQAITRLLGKPAFFVV